MKRQGKAGCRAVRFGIAAVCAALCMLCVQSILSIRSGGLFGAQPVYAKDAEGNIVIAIDPGHGGNDPGKIGVNGVNEEDANFEIARAMMEELKKYENVRVYMTRAESDWNSNTGRAMVAAAMDADFLISIHNNSGTDTSSGAIVYTSVLPLYSTITTDMGNYILGNLEQLGIKNNGVQTRNSTEYAGEDYYTIMAEAMRAGTPAVLIEHCFLSNPEDSLHVSHQDGSLDYEKITKIGQADAAAVVTYFNLQKKTAYADSATTLKLEKGYSVQVIPHKEGTGNISWISSNSNAVTVDGSGFATAVGSGTANIMYSYEDGTNAYLTVEVAVPRQTALVGATDHTFYYSQEEFNNIDLAAVFATIIYSDGTAARVKPDNVGSVDLSRKGIQDIPITYGGLNGSVRVMFSPPDYVPEVTSKETQQQTEPEPDTTAKPNPEDGSTSADATQSKPEETSKDSGDTAEFDLMMIIKLVAGIIIVAVFASVIYLLESRRGRKKKNRRRRR